MDAAAPTPQFVIPRHAAQWLKAMLGATLIFNLLDAVCTLFVVLAGLAAEANPIMNEALRAGPVAFTVFKMALVSAGVWVLWRERARPLAVVGIVGTFVAYFAIVTYHATALATIAADHMAGRLT